MNSRSKVKAFTLIEILLVVGIIAILLAIAVPNFIAARARSNAQSCIVNLHEIDAAKDMLRVDLHLSDSVTPTAAELTPTYMKAFPTCPSGGVYSINSIDQNPTCTIGGSYPHKM